MKKQIILSLVILCLAWKAQAQKKPYLDQEQEIVELAKQTLDEGMKTGGFIQKTAAKEAWTGTYLFDISLVNKGEVATLRALERQGEIKTQNDLKDFIKSIRFPMKLPKNQIYKFQYEFHLK